MLLTMGYSLQRTKLKTIHPIWGSNPGPFTCKANALPLSYIPCVGDGDFICSNIEEDHVGMNNQQKVHVPTGGLEPPIFGLGDRRLIH